MLSPFLSHETKIGVERKMGKNGSGKIEKIGHHQMAYYCQDSLASLCI